MCVCKVCALNEHILSFFFSGSSLDFQGISQQKFLVLKISSGVQFHEESYVIMSVQGFGQVS